MTANERAELAALNAKFEAFMETQTKANEDLKGDIKSLRAELRVVQDLRQKIGGVVLVLSVALAVPLGIAWKWVWARIAQ